MIFTFSIIFDGIFIKKNNNILRWKANRMEYIEEKENYEKRRTKRVGDHKSHNRKSH